MSIRNNKSKRKSPKRYPVQFHGETGYVTVPGSGGLEPGPDDETEFEKFLAEAIEAYAEASETSRPQINTFAETGVLTRNHGLVVRIGESEYQITIVRSR
ncbi:MAG: hypothetical protein JXA30_22280 [Deltaproteobacteria bacterium]|nr:hypothetical protein [Deltaproteobacteria bacterium]